MISSRTWIAPGSRIYSPDSSYVADQGIVTNGNTGKFADAMLCVGESFQVPGQTTKITVKELTSDGGIRVDY